MPASVVEIKKDASACYDKSVSIMIFLRWHNKTPVDVFSFCAKKLIYEGFMPVLRLCYGCVIRAITVLRLCHDSHFSAVFEKSCVVTVSWDEIMAHSALHKKQVSSL